MRREHPRIVRLPLGTCIHGPFQPDYHEALYRQEVCLHLAVVMNSLAKKLSQGPPLAYDCFWASLKVLNLKNLVSAETRNSEGSQEKEVEE